MTLCAIVLRFLMWQIIDNLAYKQNILGERIDAWNTISPYVPSASLGENASLYTYITHFNTADIDDTYQITMFCLLKHSKRSST